MSPTLTIGLLWAAFAATHMALSSVKLRPRLVSMLGDRGFQGMYSLLALGIFIPLVTVYFRNKHAGPLLWTVEMTPALVWVVQVLMGVAFVLLIGGILAPSAATMPLPGGSAGTAEPRGIHFITRHAVFMATALFGLVHLPANGHASDVVFFGGFPVFVALGAVHQDRRKLVTEPERYRPFYEATPLVPFTGRNTLRGLREMSKLAIVLGIAATLLVRHFHEAWFG